MCDTCAWTLNSFVPWGMEVLCGLWETVGSLSRQAQGSLGNPNRENNMGNLDKQKMGKRKKEEAILIHSVEASVSKTIAKEAKTGNSDQPKQFD